MRIASLVIAASLLGASASFAQRPIDLTGLPLHSLTEPFSQIAGVRALPGDAAIVTDQLERRVFLVNLASDAHEQIGREGSGPGEYRFPLKPLTAPNASTWMLDASLRRVLTISAAGRFQQSLAAPYAAVPGGLGAAVGTDRVGRIYFEGSSFDAETGQFSDSVGIVRWDPTSNRADIVGRVWSGGRVRVERRGGVASVARAITPFPEVDTWVVLNDGRIAVVEQHPHRVRLLSDGQESSVSAELSFARVEVTAAERNAYRAREEGARMVAADGSGGALQRPPTADAEFPAAMPAFIATSVLASPEGEIWIGRSFAFNAPTRRYDVYDATGKFVAIVTLRGDRAVVGFGARTVLVARTDAEDHLVYLESYRR